MPVQPNRRRGQRSVDSSEELLTLHRYFVWAAEMQTQLLRIFMRGREQRTVAALSAAMRDLQTRRWPSRRSRHRVFTYMSYWYGTLYVVVEGWRALRLEDPAVDRLLTSPNVDLLRRYRNAVFHYQRDYYDEKFIAFMQDGEEAAKWVATLHVTIGDAILARPKARR